MAIDWTKANPFDGVSWNQLISPVQQTYNYNASANDRWSDANSFMVDGWGDVAVQAKSLNPDASLGDDWSNTMLNLYAPGYTQNGMMTRLTRNADGSVGVSSYQQDHSIPWGAFAVMALPFVAAAAGAGAAGAGAAEAGTAAGASGASGAAGASAAGAGAAEATVALPAGGMGATGAGWGTGATTGSGALGTGTWGTGVADVGGLMGTTQGSFSMGTGLAGVSSADMAAGGASIWDTLGNKAIDYAQNKATNAALNTLTGQGQSMANGTTTQTLDPRMQQYLYGADGNSGLLAQIMQTANNPQLGGLTTWGANQDQYFWGGAQHDQQMMRDAASRLTNSNINAPQINAPAQNGLNLQPAYNNMINGEAGNNPYLTGAIQKGINQSANAFGNMVTDATKATQGLLGNIRGGAQLNNTMGSSRQGIAEGQALDSFNTNIARAASQFGQNNTDAAVAAQAGAYETDQNRALSAMQGLNASQYGAAATNAGLQQSTNQLNSANQQAGIQAGSGLLNQSYNMLANQDQYGLNKAGQVAGLLSPFTGLGATNTQTTPTYSNTAGNIIGGVAAGAGLLSAYNKAGGWAGLFGG